MTQLQVSYFGKLCVTEPANMSPNPNSFSMYIICNATTLFKKVKEKNVYADKDIY